LDRANIEVQHSRIERDLERMNALIEEVIRLARLASAPTSFQMEDVDLGALLDEIVDDVSPEAKVNGQEIRLSETRLVLRGNPEMLRRAIENVVRNAIRFSCPGTPIEISLGQEGESAVLRVRDCGPGVPEVDLTRIFDPFYRVSVAREREVGGTGLGLAITARVMSLHGGHASAGNHPDGGLIVTLVFPVSQPEVAKLAERTTDDSLSAAPFRAS
jgi:two-component system sensor histidine kinase CpxA